MPDLMDIAWSEDEAVVSKTPHLLHARRCVLVGALQHQINVFKLLNLVSPCTRGCGAEVSHDYR